MIMPGRLTKRLRFFEVVEIKNEHQAIVKSLVYLFAARAEPISNDTSKNISNDGENYSKSLSFRTRYKKRINSEMIIKVDGLELEIDSIESIGALNTELIINAVNYIQN